MAVLAVADEPESFANFFTGNTQTTTKDPNQRGGVQSTTTGTVRWEINIGSSVSECWYHGRTIIIPNTSTTVAWLSFYNSTNARDVLRILTVSSTANEPGRATYNTTGTTYVTIGSDFNIPYSDGPITVDVYFKRGTSGVFELYLSGQRVVRTTGNFATQDTTWDRIRLYSPGASSQSHGGCIVADECTVGWQLDHLSPDGAGNYSQWTNGFANIADTTGAPAVDATTEINTNTVGNRSTFTFENMMTLAASQEIPAVALAARGIRDAGSALAAVNFCARLSATDYTLGDLGLGTTASNYTQLFALDPAGNAWTESNVNAIEWGVLAS